MLLAILISGRSVSGSIGSSEVEADSVWKTISSDSSAVPAFDSASMLEDYLVVALSRNSSLKAAYFRWVAAVKRAGHVGALPDPVLSYGYYIENVETRVGPQEHRFSLRQALPWFGTLGSKKAIARESARAEYQRFESRRLELFYRVGVAYYDFYLAGRELTITRDNLELVSFWESVARSRYEVGLATHADLIRIQLELGRLEDRVATLADRLAPAAAELRALLNVPDSVVLLPPALLVVDERELDSLAVISQVLHHNPDLKMLAHVIDREEAAVRLAGKQARPRLTVGVDYIATGGAVNPDLAESGKDPWIVTAGITLPLWFGANRDRVAEAKARRLSAEHNHRDTQYQLRAAVERVLFEHGRSLRRIQLFRDGLAPKAEQSLEASFTAYETGEVDFLSLIDAQRQLLDIQLTLEKETVALAHSLARIGMLSGTPIEDLMQ